MPHLRHRYLLENLKKDLSWSPVVSVLGMRQVGKTTLLKQLGKSYLSLDDDALLRQFEQGDWGFLESSSAPVVIDEAQKSPGLFDHVKFLVDQKKKPGRFLLTGSVRFLSRKQIRESLTGRTALQELLPLTCAEAHSVPLFDLVKTLQDPSDIFLKKIGVRKRLSRLDIEHYTATGGMPGICFKRDLQVRRRMLESHLETLLMRDLQVLLKTRIPYQKLRSCLAELAQTQGQIISFSELGRKIQLSTPTVIQLFHAFEDLFLLRAHGKTHYLSDCGVADFLGAGRQENALFHMERFLYQELYAQLNYLHKSNYEFSDYTTRGGVRIPFVIKIEGMPTIAIVADATDGGSEKSLKGLTWFSKKQRSKVISVVLHQGDRGYLSSTSALCIPYDWVV